LSKVFEKRFPQALAVVEAKSVTNYRFRPSQRTLWAVKGRKGEYQVIPDSMFCTCDDYYFRVMDNKRQLCYHLVAQQIAEALGQYGVLDLADSQYTEVISKWSDSGYRKGESKQSG
jgi:predicted nucleic acid-binding Zn finger protein